MSIVNKILKESIEDNLYSIEVVNAIYGWIEMSGNKGLPESIKQILLSVNFPAHLKSDGKTLFRVMPIDRDVLTAIIENGKNITLKNLSSWSHKKEIGAFMIEQDYFQYVFKDNDVAVLFSKTINNSIVDLSLYCKDLRAETIMEDFEEDIVEEQEVIVGPNVTLSKNDIYNIMDENVSQNWIVSQNWL